MGKEWREIRNIEFDEYFIISKDKEIDVQEFWTAISIIMHADADNTLPFSNYLEKLSPKVLNATNNAEIDVIYCIRTPKTGSISLYWFINAIRKVNNFPFESRNDLKKFPLDFFLHDREDVQEKVANIVVNIKRPGIIVGRHDPFMDFRKFNLPRPIYIAFVRDPVERVISWYYYVRTDLYTAVKSKLYPPIINVEGKRKWYRKSYEECVLQGNIECQYIPLEIDDFIDYRQQSRFFCGVEYNCMVFNSKRVVQQAKENVEKHFAVVGSWEDTNITLTVLDHYLPRYFKNAMEHYYANVSEWRRINRNDFQPKVREEIKDIVKKNFTWEIDFYKFCKQRLYKQYIALYMDELRPLLEPVIIN